MREDGVGVSIALRLEYSHPLGALSPFFTALARGELMATACDRCLSTWVPPRLTCTCGQREMRWVKLSGRGVVEHSTGATSVLPASGLRAEFVFVLVRFDGASRLSLARFRGTAIPAAGTVVRLQTPSIVPVHPIECLEVAAA